VRRDEIPGFGFTAKENKVAGDSLTPLDPAITEPELSSNATPPREPVLAAAAAAANDVNTGLAGEIILPVINCGIWE
jgi:hypothetical protein